MYRRKERDFTLEPRGEVKGREREERGGNNDKNHGATARR